MITLAQKREPSLRTRQPSSSKRPSRPRPPARVAESPEIDSLFWVKGRERFAEDFIGGVAFDPLGSLVPAHNAAFGIEHEDGVIPDAPNEQLETLFAPAQFFLRTTPPDRTSVHVGGSSPMSLLLRTADHEFRLKKRRMRRPRLLDSQRALKHAHRRWVNFGSPLGSVNGVCCAFCEPRLISILGVAGFDRNADGVAAFAMREGSSCMARSEEYRRFAKECLEMAHTASQRVRATLFTNGAGLGSDGNISGNLRNCCEHARREKWKLGAAHRKRSKHR